MSHQKHLHELKRLRRRQLEILNVPEEELVELERLGVIGPQAKLPCGTATRSNKEKSA
jgi:hypothetical protein